MEGDILRARYLVFAALGLAIGAFLLFETTWSWPVSLAVALLASLALTSLLEMILRQRASALERARQAEQAVSDMQRQARLVFSTQQKFLSALSERDVLEATLSAGCALTGAQGASFMPFDEYGQALPALVHGAVPDTTLQSWSNRLTAPEMRQVCKSCKSLEGALGCVLLPADVKKPSNTRCFYLRVADRQAGLLNYFFDTPQALDESRRALLAEILHSASKALETLRTRDQEMAALRYLQTASAPRSDLSRQLNDLLAGVQKALDTDFALLYIPGGIENGMADSPLLLSRSRPDDAVELPDLPFLEGLWKSVLASNRSLSLENVTLDGRAMWKVLLAVPLTWQPATQAGVLVLGSNSAQVFAHRQRVLLETLAGQAALLIQNARLMVQVEYQAVVDERTRLAREIHDGLAQTLAFLKIQASQMQTYLTRGDTERLSSTLQASYRTISDAYLDARQAIDNLRRVPSAGLQDWMQQVAEDFQQSSSIPVRLAAFEVRAEFSPNVQAQLIRVVQEALSNVRKHAQATQVSISARERQGLMLLEVRDNGVGFSPDTVNEAARYGLRGMRERADSIGAEFQITSRSGEGTTILLSVPAPIKEEL